LGKKDLQPRRKKHVSSQFRQRKTTKTGRRVVGEKKKFDSVGESNDGHTRSERGVLND